MDEGLLDTRVICTSPQEIKPIIEQIELYNVSAYVLVESTIKKISTDLEVEALKPADKENMLADIFELVPLYIDGWSIIKHGIRINENLTIYLTLDFGLPGFIIEEPTTPTSEGNLKLAVMRFYWVPTTHEFKVFAKLDLESEKMVLLEDYVLRIFHEELVSLYSKRKTPESGPASTQNSPATLNEAASFTFEYHRAVAALTQNANLPSDVSKSPIPSLRLSVFIKFMETKFDCITDNGKGSELKIWCKGSRIFTIGRHKKDPKIPSFLIKNILHRLNIDKQDWLQALQAY